MKIAKWGMAALLALSAGVAAAQEQSTQTTTPQQTDQKKTQKQDDQQDALAAASRHTREQKKQQQKPAKVWTNDNIPTTPNSINVVGEEHAPANPETTPAETKPEQPKPAEPGGAQSNEERKADLEKQLADAKEQLQSLTTDFDILSRKHQLDQQMYYGKPDYASDTEGAAALQVEAKDMAAKQQQVSAQQKKVDDLTAELKELEEKR